MHKTVAIGTDGKKKPETVEYYNATKLGVDVLDQMASQYSSLIPSPSARNLGVIFDSTLSLSDHITAITRTCRFHLFNIRKIRPSISLPATKLLVHSLLFTRLDYCNSLLLGLPSYAFTPLQRIQKASGLTSLTLPIPIVSLCPTLALCPILFPFLFPSCSPSLE
ncbi:UNVERIFIED_CONTAM: hypothetical protein FKN15_067282 [Acipenser sinensis]